MDYFENKQFSEIDFRTEPFVTGEYDNCTFTRCDLSDVVLNNSEFIDCSFSFCNLSNAKADKSSFRTVAFEGSKLTGVDLSNCTQLLLEVSFHECLLDYASLARLPLKKTIFESCSMRRTFFDNADLSEAVFRNCDLENAVFIGTNLQKADLSTSYNFIIDPDANKLKKAKFSLAGAVGLLSKYGIIIE